MPRWCLGISINLFKRFKKRDVLKDTAFWKKQIANYKKTHHLGRYILLIDFKKSTIHMWHSDLTRKITLSTTKCLHNYTASLLAYLVYDKSNEYIVLHKFCAISFALFAQFSLVSWRVSRIVNLEKCIFNFYITTFATFER